VQALIGESNHFSRDVIEDMDIDISYSMNIVELEGSLGGNKRLDDNASYNLDK
jgi:hypothetical protein